MRMTTTKLLMRSGMFGLLVIAFAGTSVHGQTSHTVNVTSNVFAPDELTVTAGDTVKWTNTQGSHNVNGLKSKFPDNPESFGNDVGTGWVFEHVFAIPGTYNYQCDPHAAFGMTGVIIVQEAAAGTLTINFTGMTPHVGQTLWLLVTDDTGEDVARLSRVVETVFSVDVPGIEAGQSYTVDFFADHNGNGFYDAPPADHAWRLETGSATGDVVLDFVHNTNFTDVDWKHRLKVRFAGMTPHVGQMLTLYVREAATGSYLDTVVVDAIGDPDFDVESYAIEPGGSYFVDFYADHNGNGVYDAPPADHAWRLETGETMGDAELDFTHSTNFTDIFSTTSTGPDRGTFQLSVYPNPANDVLHIISGEPVVSVSVISVTGSQVIRVTDRAASRTISLEGIASGIYFVEVTTADQQTAVSRVMKK